MGSLMEAMSQNSISPLPVSRVYFTLLKIPFLFKWNQYIPKTIRVKDIPLMIHFSNLYSHLEVWINKARPLPFDYHSLIFSCSKMIRQLLADGSPDHLTSAKLFSSSCLHLSLTCVAHPLQRTICILCS